MNILVAEDNAVLNDFYSAILGKYGIVDKVTDGNEAIEQYENALSQDLYYDIIFLDIMMPGASGIEVLEHIRFAEEDLGLQRSYIVIMTSMKDVNTIGEAIKNLSDKFLIKPTYVEKIREIIEYVQAQKENRGD